MSKIDNNVGETSPDMVLDLSVNKENSRETASPRTLLNVHQKTVSQDEDSNANMDKSLENSIDENDQNNALISDTSTNAPVSTITKNPPLPLGTSALMNMDIDQNEFMSHITVSMK